MHEDRQHTAQVVSMVTDPEKQKELLQQDEEEDFLDEGNSHIKQINNHMSLVVFI